MGTAAGPNIVKSGLSLYLDMKNKYSFSSGNSTWYDLTGNNHNGSLMLNPTYNNGVITLDGTSYISIPNSNYLNSSVFTFCVWVRNTDKSLNWNRLMSKKNAYTDTNGYEISLSTGTDQTLYIGGSDGSFATISNFCNWFDYKWHYVVVTFSGTTTTAYCDGVYKGSGSIASIVSNSRDLSLGRIDGEAGLTQWYGDYSVVQMYNRVLSSSEILQNYNSLKYRYLNNSSVVTSFLETDTSLWLKADNPLNTNVRWFDSSPNNHILTGTATLTDNVLNGQKGYTFNGISDFFDGGDILDIGLNSRRSIVIAQSNTRYGVLFGKSLWGDIGGRYQMLYDLNWGNGFYMMFQDGIIYKSMQTEISLVPNFHKHESILNRDVDFANMTINNVERSYAPMVDAFNFQTPFNFLVGAANNIAGSTPPQAGYYLNGTICEIIFFDRNLTTDENIELDAYLLTKYGI